MKKILKNKKGFTLVELLAVIVILAIIMVIATQQIGKVIAGARADSFVESYQMVAKQVKTFIATDQTVCTGTSCADDFGLSSDYSLKVETVPATGTSITGYKITLSVASTISGGDTTYTGKFANINLNEDGKATKKNAAGKDVFDATKVGYGATETNADGKQIVGTINLDD